METVDFLRMVWPSQGPYILATPFNIPNTEIYTWVHKVVDDIDEALVFANQQMHRKDVYFCIHAIRDKDYVDPNKVDYKTGQKGAKAVRKQQNMREGRTLFFDLDVGDTAPTDPFKKYASQKEALKGLKEFCAAAKLPRPFISSSGGGLHVFWPLSEPLESNTDWVALARKLRTIAAHYKLRFDPSRTTDTSSVLRVPGTFNHKKGEKRPVKLLAEPTAPISPEDMARRLDDALIAAGLPTDIILHALKSVPGFEGIESNTGNIQSSPPVLFPALVKGCAQIRNVLQLKGDVSEPLWYATLGVVRFVKDGNKACHFISEGAPSYSYEATEQKIYQHESAMVGPTGCLKFEELNPAGCEGCPRKGNIKSPIVAGRYEDLAPQPTVQIQVEEPAPAPAGTATVAQGPAAPVVVQIPNPPPPYKRLSGGAVVIEVGDKDEPEKRSVEEILPYDFYPIKRMADSHKGEEQHVWRAVLPRTGVVELELAADSMYESRKLAIALSNRGIFPNGGKLDLLRGYMIAYIRALQEAADVEALKTHLGWSEDYTSFTMPDKTLMRDGSTTPNNLTRAALIASEAVHKAGNLQTQLELLKFYAHPGYTASQFIICSALASPIYHATGHHGVIINMSGPSGASKSTTLYTAASLWGNPKAYCINGTNSGATARARENRMHVNANLPHLVDEITLMPHKAIADMAMNISQSGNRLRLSNNGAEQENTGGIKSGIMVSTANTGLYSILSSERGDSTAESMRVFECQFEPGRIHQKHEADLYLRQLSANYGHIGEIFMAYVVKHYEAVVARVQEVMAEIDVECEIESSERFWSAVVATAVVGCEVAQKLGVLPYKAEDLRHWFVTTQLPAMRGTLQEHYSGPLGALSEFLESINGNMLVLQRGNSRAFGNISNILRSPDHGQLLARHESDVGTMWVLKKAFKDYCTRTGHNFTAILNELYNKRIIVSKHDHKTLGAGTDFAKGQAWCFVVNMNHPEMNEIEKKDGKILSYPPAKKGLLPEALEGSVSNTANS
jgi:hypothetical protein